MTFGKKAKLFLSRIPLWTQLALFTTLITFSVFFYLIYTSYQRSLQVITKTETETSCRMLSLEMQELETYIQELSLFCVQGCYDPAFNHIVEKTDPFQPGEEAYLKNRMRTWFYSRNDLKGFDFYLFNHSLRFHRTQNGTRTLPFSLPELTDSVPYRQCTRSNSFHAILPAENESDVLFRYCHFLLQIRTRQPIALVDLTIDKSYWHTLNGNHQRPGEFIVLIGEDKNLLHSGNESLLSFSSQEILQQIGSLPSGSSLRCSLGGEPWLVTCAEGDIFHLKLLAFLPVSYMDEQIAKVRYSVLAVGLLISLCVLLLITSLIRLLTRPLTILANKLNDVGKGDFTSTMDSGGSLEISNLSRSFNDMTLHIDHLIKENYVVKLREKTARITALEAQLNPHFLYNTLQAIATEALVNEQIQIYNMITSLASGLRYTIKGGDCVPLCREMEYTRSYVLLQKMRMDDRLQVSFEIAENTKDLIIPKISIQLLVENSVLHGLGPDRDSISIRVQSLLRDQFLYIMVTDNGCGIDDNRLTEIRMTFRSQETDSENSHIGLSSLHGRLLLLYHGQARMEIDTVPGSHTKITLIIPATKEAPHV